MWRFRFKRQIIIFSFSLTRFVTECKRKLLQKLKCSLIPQTLHKHDFLNGPFLISSNLKLIVKLLPLFFLSPLVYFLFLFHFSVANWIKFCHLPLSVKNTSKRNVQKFLIQNQDSKICKKFIFIVQVNNEKKKKISNFCEEI